MCQPHVLLYKFCACRGAVVMKPCRDPSPSIYNSPSTTSSSTTAVSSSSSSSSSSAPRSRDECPSAPSAASVLKMRLSQLPTIELHCYCEIHSEESFTTRRTHNKKMKKRKGKGEQQPSTAAEDDDATTIAVSGREDVGAGEKRLRKWELEARARRLEMRDEKGQGRVLEARRKSIVEVMRGLRVSRAVNRPMA
ncbi:MAG: hypothetical protein Q9160_008244 [Pyrenula sp. 1 TL-2023]